MDVDQLFSIIEEEKTYTEETISDVKILIEKFPYFQTGHMLLLKAIHANQPDKFNDQLNISGSFIPDKVRLFKFINNQIETIEREKIEPEKEDAKDHVEISGNQKIETEQEPETEKKEKVISKERTVKDIKTELKKSTPVAKEEVSKEEVSKKEVELEVVRVKKEPQVKIKEIKKTETKQADINVIENSKKRHKKIVKDFFIDPSKNVSIIDETTEEALIPRKKEPKKETELKDKLVDTRKPFIDKKNRRVEKEQVVKEQTVVEKKTGQKQPVKPEKAVSKETIVNAAQKKGIRGEDKKETTRFF